MARSVAHQISKQIQNLPPPPPWVEELEAKHPDLYLCHCNPSELKSLDTIRGRPSIDETTGLRTYEDLEPIFEKEEARDIVLTIFNDLKDDGELSPNVEDAYKKAKKLSPSLPFEKTPIEKTKPVEEIEETGRFGDKELAWFPKSLVFLLLDLHNGDPSINPSTGLLEFFFGGIGKIFRPIQNIVSAPFKAVNKVTGSNIGTEALRVAGTVLGAWYGGPAGAGLGNAASHWATGNKPLNSGISGLKNWGLASAAQGLGNYMGSPQAGGMFGGQGYGIEGKLGSHAPSWVGGNKGALSAEADLLSKAKDASGLESSSLANATSGPVKSTVKSSPGFFDKLGEIADHKLFMPAVMGAGAYLSYKGEKDKEKYERQRDREEKESYKKHLEDTGFYKPYNRKKHHYTKNPNYHPSEEDIALGRYPEDPYLYQEQKKGGRIKKYNSGGFVSASEGGGIHGPGDGQSDSIKTKVPANTYIIDATSVAHYGNGSSDNGIMRLKESSMKLRNRTPLSVIRNLENHFHSNPEEPDVYLSNKEYANDPLTVSLIGYHKGAKTIPEMINKGSATLKKGVINLRKDMRRNGLDLPPKSQDPLVYMGLEKRVHDA